MRPIFWTVGILVAVLLAMLLVQQYNTPKPPVEPPMPVVVEGPHVTAARKRVAEVNDKRMAAAIKRANIARPIPCGMAVDIAFDVDELGKPTVWTSRAPDGRIICHDSEGINGATGAVAQPMSEADQREIRSHPLHYPRYTVPIGGPTAADDPYAAPVRPQSGPAREQSRLLDPRRLPVLDDGPCEEVR